MMTVYIEFINQFITRLREHPSERVGQAWFNALAGFNNELANEIRTSDIDPFHKDSVSCAAWKVVWHAYNEGEEDGNR
jgi:hypothetical protein